MSDYVDGICQGCGHDSRRRDEWCVCRDVVTKQEQMAEQELLAISDVLDQAQIHAADATIDGELERVQAAVSEVAHLRTRVQELEQADLVVRLTARLRVAIGKASRGALKSFVDTYGANLDGDHFTSASKRVEGAFWCLLKTHPDVVLSNLHHAWPTNIAEAQAECAAKAARIDTLEARVQELEQELALFKKKAHDWNAEADRYLAQRDELQVALEAAEASLLTAQREIRQQVIVEVQKAINSWVGEFLVDQATNDGVTVNFQSLRDRVAALAAGPAHTEKNEEND